MPVDFERVYSLFDDVTPLAIDCGQICKAACCRGGPEKGMLLFPGEQAFLSGRWPDTAFHKTRQGDVLFVCGGSCDRCDRPLSCRIFPLFPFYGRDGRIRAGRDPRAFPLCPLARFPRQIPLRRDFVRRVRRAGRLLAADSACRRFLQEQTLKLEEFVRLLPESGGRSPIQRRKVEVK